MAFTELGQLVEVQGHSSQELAQPDIKAGPKALSQEVLVIGGEAIVTSVPCSPTSNSCHLFNEGVHL